MGNRKYNQAIKTGIKVLLEASDYLAGCGKFNSEKLDHWQTIMLRNPLFEEDVAERDAIQFKKLAVVHANDSGRPIWEKIKDSIQIKLAENLNLYLRHFVEENANPDAETAAFYKWARNEVLKIGSKIDAINR